MENEKIIIHSSKFASAAFEQATGAVLKPLSNDLLFHIVLQNSKPALKGFICSLLSLKHEEVKDVEIENPICYGDYLNAKQIVLDSKVLLNNDTVVNIEIQNQNAENWNDRVLFYTCRNMADLNEGDDYSRLKTFYQIGIIDFNLAGKEPEFYAHYELRNVANLREIFNRKMAIFVLCLKQTERATKLDTDSGRLHWAKLFKATTWDEIKSLSNKYPDIKEAAHTMYTATAEKRIRQELEAIEKGRRDRLWLMNSARREGLAKGMAEGLEKGIAEGKAKGKAEGKAEERALSKKIIRMYFKEQKSIEEIAAEIGISAEEVHDLVN